MSRSQPASPAGEPIGLFYTWWAGDPLPALPDGDDLVAGPAAGLAAIEAVTSLAPAEVLARLDGGHEPYLATLQGVPVGAGWVARREASIGSLGATFALPLHTAYLWDFTTLAWARGRAVYPRLLRAILDQESPRTTRFWIGHDRENTASGRGILKAGFTLVGAVYALPEGALGLLPSGAAERAEAAAALVGMTLLPARVEPARGA